MECSICNSEDGEETRIEFSDSSKTVTLPMGDECYEDFLEDDGVTVVRMSEVVD
jgi:hypothetical protein